TTPLGVVADSQIIASMVDGTILVVKSGKTKKEKLVEAKKILDQVEGKLIGVIMNWVKSEKTAYYYY
ncbi:MAG: CpsD/CapB family tyrosine-protein kinase, partial [Clostridium sp.]